jgi:hypothetical protein
MELERQQEAQQGRDAKQKAIAQLRRTHMAIQAGQRLARGTP